MQHAAVRYLSKNIKWNRSMACQDRPAQPIQVECMSSLIRLWYKIELRIYAPETKKEIFQIQQSSSSIRIIKFSRQFLNEVPLEIT